tara:strand:- start:507 stop:1232 length:726 start_codon:yes stop_codon:yes gene_type:complete
MWDLLYYLAGVGMVGTVGYGLLYIFDRDTANDVAQQVSWNAVKAYHKANLEINNIKRWYDINTRERVSRSDDEEDEIELEEVIENNNNIIEFIGYNKNDDTTYTSYNLEENSYIDDTQFDLMFLKKKEKEIELYKRITNKEDIDQNVKMNKIDKPFIQVELCQNEEKTSIHKKLEGFYLEDNTLLDESFLEWYVKTFYAIILDDDYKLSVIDSDVNMFKIEKGQRVDLNDKKQYQLITEDK